MNDKKFANGIIFKRNDNAPEYVIGKLSIAKESFQEFLDTQPDGWVNLEIKKSQKGTYYIEVDNWKPVMGSKG